MPVAGCGRAPPGVRWRDAIGGRPDGAFHESSRCRDGVGGIRAGMADTVCSSGIDQTPPSLTVDVRPAFVVGNIVANGLEFDHGSVHDGYRATIQWSATDDVGVCWYNLYAEACR